MHVLGLLAAFAVGLLTTTHAYNNPVSWMDLADVDIRNVNGTYYYSSSNFHYSPGAPILRSGDLVNWEMIGHSVPRLSQFGEQYSLPSSTNRAYRGGTWASWLDYNRFDGKWYWGGCINFWRTVVYSAPQVTGPWTIVSDFQGSCFYDSGLLIDDDGTPYVSYKDTNIWVAQLSKDFKTIVSKTQVFTLPSDIASSEGTRPYKYNGQYYIFFVNPGVAEYVMRSTTVLGQYTARVVTSNAPGPIAGVGAPVQGAIVKANSGQWYYMCFSWAFPIGRVPILAPMTWSSDGWPSVNLVNGGIAASYPNTEPVRTVPAITGTDNFSGTTLNPRWEWNHDPDTAYYTVNNGLTLRTATVTNDIYTARNTLTQRLPGTTATATIRLSIGSMANGDRAGLAMFKDKSAAIRLAKDNGSVVLQLVTGMDLDQTLSTVSNGVVQATAAFTGTTVYLRVTANSAPTSDKLASFSYSTNGSSFTKLGPSYNLDPDWWLFLGYRFAIFNFATTALGGSITVNSYTVTTP